MVTAEIVGTSALIIEELGKLGKWLQAIGTIVVLWLAFQIVNLVLRWRWWKEILILKEKIASLDGKINRLLKKMA